MKKYLITENERLAILDLLGRTQIQGNEVPAFNKILQVLNTPYIEDIKDKDKDKDK